LPLQSIILGFSGGTLTSDEKAFFKDANPFGYILFARNVEDPRQLRALTDDLRDLSGREDTPILIDQEGGRVARMRPPSWREAPAAAAFGALYERDPKAALEAVWLNSRLFAMEQHEAGINVDCLPMLDVRTIHSNDVVIGDRAYSDQVGVVTALGRAAANGLLAGGVLPVMKHLPGHGRATVDSHDSVPVVKASSDELELCDFAPFRALADLPIAMTGHLIFESLAGQEVSTVSKTLINEVIRSTKPGRIGFDGLLLTDDLSMKALSGGFGERTAAALEAGCDIVLHCNGDRAEMGAVVANSRSLEGISLDRADRALKRLVEPEDFDDAEARNRLQGLMAGQNV
jgi:beta-N-acetylhexosaminidase